MAFRKSKAAVFVFVVLFACDLSSAQAGASNSDSIQKSVTLGMTLFAHDKAAYRASDALVERGILKSDPRIRGWLSAIAEDRKSVSVLFIGDDSGKSAVLYEVKVPMVEGEGKLEVSAISPPKVLGETLESRWHARQAAIRILEQQPTHCSTHYNTAVFSSGASAGADILVYLIPVAEEQDTVIVDGYILIEFSPDGRRVVTQKEFGQKCNQALLDEKHPGLKIVREQAAVPTEIDVYLSRTTSRPLSVTTQTNGTMWTVNGPKIEKVN